MYDTLSVCIALKTVRFSIMTAAPHFHIMAQVITRPIWPYDFYDTNLQLFEVPVHI